MEDVQNGGNGAEARAVHPPPTQMGTAVGYRSISR
jgi:hypothetical protein